jgi:hypothetical protein
MNNLAIAQALVFEQRTAFAELDARPRYWWPLLVLGIASGALAFWYTSVVDLEWLVHQQMSSSSFGANMTEDEIARMARTAADQQGFRAVLAGCANALGVGVGMLISALYFLLAGKVTGVERSFRHWFSLSCWVSLPTALGVIAAAFVLLSASSAQIPQQALQPLSLNELFFHREPGQTGSVMLSYISVLNFVTLYLGTVAVRLWSGRTWLFSFLFNALPWIVAFGIWALFALR